MSNYDAPFLSQSLLEYSQCGDYEALQAVLDEGKHVPNFVDSVDVDNGSTALHYACQRGYLEIVSLLLRNGAKINVFDKVCVPSYCFLQTL